MDIKTVYISSKNRTSGTSDDFIIEDTNERYINTPISMKAKTITIPYMWNNIVGGVGGNNTFAFTVVTPVPGSYTFTLPSANYTGASLAAALQTQMNVATGGGLCGGGYTVTYNATTSTFTFTSLIGTFDINFVIGTMANILGFVPGTITPVASTISSTGVASILIDFEIWVCTDLISGVDNGVADWTGNNPASEQMGILACVPITTCFGGIINYTVPDEFPFYTITNSGFTLEQRSSPRASQYYLRFPSGTPLSLNGNNWSMQVLFNFNE
jgi:hypothetical protein